jgi:DNA-binding transcriptional ArsR family regulator
MRIHFTRLDLARTHVANGPDAMWELVNSLQALQSRYGQSVLGGWRRRVAGELRGNGWAGPVRHRLFPVAPHASYFPDMLTPPEGALGVSAGVEAVMATPRRLLRAEFAHLLGGPRTGSWLDDLSCGRTRALMELGRAMRAFYDCAVAPCWESLRTSVGDDIAARRAAGHAGVEALLDSFRPIMQWQYPVLELPDHPSRRDVHLDGRGLLLIPSYFCQLHPLTIFDPELPQVVVYPIDHRPAPVRLADSHRALVRLLGETRAAVLLAVGGGGSPSELARRLGVSAAAISHHTTILRDAGLITSRRSANTVRHSLSRLGDALIRRHTDH